MNKVSMTQSKSNNNNYNIFLILTFCVGIVCDEIGIWNVQEHDFKFSVKYTVPEMGIKYT